MTAKRHWYAPREFARKIEADDGSAEVYVISETKGDYRAMAFGGRRSKPDWHYRFVSPETMADRIENFLDSMAKSKAARKARTTKPRTAKVGDIYYSSWGYDQTNVNWYKVTKLIGKTMVELVEIAGRVVSDHGPTVNVVAGETVIGEPMRRRATSEYGIKINDCYSAYPWDGKPKYRTGAGWGH